MSNHEALMLYSELVAELLSCETLWKDANGSEIAQIGIGLRLQRRLNQVYDRWASPASNIADHPDKLKLACQRAS